MNITSIPLPKIGEILVYQIDTDHYEVIGFDRYRVILKPHNFEFKDGRKFTLQEKILTFKGESTLTYEQYKRSGKLGGFYYCTANLYFIGYNKSNNIINIDDYILVNNVSLRLDNDINWIVKQNQKEGRKEVFRYINFNDIPEKHIIKRKQIFIQNNEAPSEDLLFSFITL